MAVILIVDDLATNRDVLVSVLKHRGHRLLEARDGSEGLTAARAERPDVVITDVLMPTMDGFEFVRQLRIDPEMRTVPVVFYTAHYGEREARTLALSSAASRVLTKPAEPETILALVDEMLSGEASTAAPPASELPAPEFDREHLRLLTDKLSEKADDLRSANARLRALINIGLELASERNTEQLLENVCVSALELFGAAYVTLGIMGRTDGTVERLTACGTPATQWVEPGDLAPGILSTVVTERRTIRGNNPGGHTAALHLPMGHPPIHTFLAAPVASPAHVYGWLCLVGPEGHTFTEEDEQLAIALAGQVGRVYENGHFYEVAQKRAEQLEREILERRQGEAALREERDRGQRYLDTAQVILLALDLNGRITLINRYGCSILGRPAEDLLGRDWIDTCLPARCRQAMRDRFDALMEGDVSVVENSVLTRSGDEREIEWRTTLLRTDDGQVVGALNSGTDITDRKRAEAALQQTETRLAFALQRSHTGGWELNLADHTAHRTLEHDRIFGYHDLLPNWTYERFLEHVLPEDRAEVDRLFQHAVASRTDWAFECRIRRTDGEVRWIWATGGHQVDGEGRTRRLAGIVQDITERKRVEEEVNHRAQLSALGAAVGLAMTTTDSLGNALQQCAEALVGYLDGAFARIWTLNERENVLELQASAGIYTHLNGAHARVPVGQFKIGRIARDRRPHLTNTVVGDPEVSDQDWARREGMVAFAGHPLIVNGRVVGVMAVFARHRLSEAQLSGLAPIADHVALGIDRHRSSAELRTAEERMRFALENANVGIWDMDYRTGVLRWSEVLEAQYGMQPGTFGGTLEAFLERVHPDDRESLIATIESAVKTGNDFTVQHRAVLSDGTVRSLSGTGRVLLDEAKMPVRGVGVSMDVTDRRSLEAQYQHAQKMEAVGRLAGGVAHDFNNLLTAILGYCELLRSDLAPDDPSQRDVEEIHKAGTSAAALTRQLLAFSRKQIVEPVVLDLDEILVSMQVMLERLIGEDIKVVLNLRPHLGRVRADRGQVEQVILNLAVNARDAMPRGGTLTIETANRELDENYGRTHLAVRPGAYVALTVTDTGTGMTPEVQSRIFEPFFTTKELGKGTGLGLATVHGIVAGIGGTVNVYSEVGRGTAFTIYLPRTDAAVAAVTPSVQVTETRTTGQTVLVVDDASGPRELAKRLLERQGYSVFVASNANEALSLFERHAAIDLLLTDVVMPGASGPELTTRLMQQRPSLKVVFMSGYTEEAIVQHGVLNAGIAFIHKPFTSETLSRKLREVFDR